MKTNFHTISRDWSLPNYVSIERSPDCLGYDLCFWVGDKNKNGLELSEFKSYSNLHDAQQSLSYWTRKGNYIEL